MMKDTNHRELHIAASPIVTGCILGFCLGILSSICSSVSLKALGRPDFLIRPGWEDLHVAMMAIGGVFAGALLGALLLAIQNVTRSRIPIIPLCSVTLLEGAVFFVTLDYVSISTENLNIHLSGHAIVFVVAVVNALMLVKKPKELIRPEGNCFISNQSIMPNKRVD
jgi:hypothetical protein